MKSLFLSALKKINCFNLGLLIPFFLISFFLVIIPLAIVIVFALKPVNGLNIYNNFETFNQTTGNAIWNSLWLSILTTVICLIISYPFAYSLSFSQSKIFKTVVLIVVSAPIWSSFLIKLIGLKSLLDIINGGANSTFGSGYTFLGMTYIYIPFAIMPIYSVFDRMPKNIINASQDLGYNSCATFFKIVIPYSRIGMMSAIIMVFLPSFTTVAIGQFLNNSNSSELIGSINYEQGILGLNSQIALARSAALSLVISIIIFSIYGLIVFVPKIWKVLFAQSKVDMFQNEFNFVYKLSKKKIFKQKKLSTSFNLIKGKN